MILKGSDEKNGISSINTSWSGQGQSPNDLFKFRSVNDMKNWVKGKRVRVGEREVWTTSDGYMQYSVYVVYILANRVMIAESRVHANLS